MFASLRTAPDPDTFDVIHEGVRYPVAVRRAANAQRFTLRVRNASRDVVLTLPVRARFSEARAFAERHGAWIAVRIAKLPQTEVLSAGSVVPFRGAPHPIVHRPDRRAGVFVEEGAIHVCGDPAFIGRRVQDFLKKQALAAVTEATRRHAATLGVSVTRISVRDQTSRWGSCSSSGAISYSWRLILAPTEVLDYLCAHEVAHRVEMNHSMRFWRLVRQLDPDMDKAMAWLKRNGAELHRYEA